MCCYTYRKLEVNKKSDDDEVTSPLLLVATTLSRHQQIPIHLIYTHTKLVHISLSSTHFHSSNKIGFTQKSRNREKSASSMASSAVITAIRGAILALALIVFLGNIMMWIIMPTDTYYNNWLLHIMADTNSTYFGIQGHSFLFHFSLCSLMFQHTTIVV